MRHHPSCSVTKSISISEICLRGALRTFMPKVLSTAVFAAFGFSPFLGGILAAATSLWEPMWFPAVHEVAMVLARAAGTASRDLDKAGKACGTLVGAWKQGYQATGIHSEERTVVERDSGSGIPAVAGRQLLADQLLDSLWCPREDHFQPPVAGRRD